MTRIWRAAILGGLLCVGAGWTREAWAQEVAPTAAVSTAAASTDAAPAPGRAGSQETMQGRDPLKGIMTPRVVPTPQPPEAQICAEPTSPPKIRAESCTKLIASGKWQGEQIAWAYANRCVALFKLDQRDKAGADCSKALELEPKNLVALQVRGMMARDRGDDDHALADFDAAAALGLKNAALFLDRGNILLARGDVERALADYEQAAQLSPDSAVVYLARANARLAAGDLAGAVVDGAKAEQLAPNSEPAVFTRGVTALLAGDRDAAEAALRKALTLAPKDPYPALWLDLSGGGRNSGDSLVKDALAAFGDKPDAAWPAPVARFDLDAVDREKLLETAQSPAQRCEAYFYLGDRLLNKGDKDAGLAALRKALEICPKNFIEYGGARAILTSFDPPAATKAEPVQPASAKPDAAAEAPKAEAPKTDAAKTDAPKSEDAKPAEASPATGAASPTTGAAAEPAAK